MLVEAQGVIDTAPKEPLWEGGFFEMGLQGDRQHLHKRENLLMELEKSLALNISPRMWGDHSPQPGSGRCPEEER